MDPNFTDDEAASWAEHVFGEELEQEPNFTFAVFQLERCPDTERLHLQGYLKVKRPTRITALKKWPTFPDAHFEPRFGTEEQAIAYCEKEESRVAGPWRRGHLARQGERTDLVAVCESIKEGKSLADIAEHNTATFLRYPRGIERVFEIIGKLRKCEWEMEVIVLWGSSGSGKTTLAKQSWPDHYLFMPQRGSTTWWNNYKGEETIIIDEFANNFPFHYALQLLEQPGIQVETKGGTVQLTAKRIVITSMKSPIDWWPNQIEDRLSLYRRLSRVYRCSGSAKRGTEELQPDYMPFALEQYELETHTGIELWQPSEPYEEPARPMEENVPSLLEEYDSFLLEWDF